MDVAHDHKHKEDEDTTVKLFRIAMVIKVALDELLYNRRNNGKKFILHQSRSCN